VAGFVIISGEPAEVVELYCLKCNKTILPAAPVEVEMRPEGMSLASLMSSASCLTGKHPMKLRKSATSQR
jgi:hypothetical protein